MSQRDDFSPGKRRLEDVLRLPEVASTSVDGDHVDLADLAAWVDGELPAADSAKLEDHLAACADCRGLAIDVAAACQESDRQAESPPLAGRRVEATDAGLDMDSPVTGSADMDSADMDSGPQIHPRFARPSGPDSDHPTTARRWILAAAAVVLLALGIGRIAQVDPRLRELGIGLDEALMADRHLLSVATEALEGGWPELGVLAELPPPAAFSTLRGPATQAAPLPLSPRWESTPDPSPTFRWSLDISREHSLDASGDPPKDAPGDAPRERFELVILDARDQQVVHVEIQAELADPAGNDDNSEGRATQDPTTTAQLSQQRVWTAVLPDNVSLKPGGIYAWKVNRLDANGWPVASPYIPFRVLPAAEAVELQRRLAQESDPLLRATLRIQSGVYSSARADLDQLDGPEELRRRLLRPLLMRQHLAAETVPENESAPNRGSS